VSARRFSASSSMIKTRGISVGGFAPFFKANLHYKHEFFFQRQLLNFV
jgi:hypothetical protein